EPACTMDNSYQRLCNNASTGSNAEFTVGNVLHFTLITRDQFGNRMENLLAGGDVRAYLRSKTIASSQPSSLKRVSGGEYSRTLAPTAASSDYTLTVLVSGSDVFEGPFHPVMLPTSTRAATSTLVNEVTGLSVINYALPLGTVTLLLTLRDRF